MTPVHKRLSWLVCACCLLFPLSAAAEGLLTDLDGDGRSDVVIADAQGHGLSVWLSATGRTQRIHTKAQPQQVIAVDLDGDARPELIWSDANAQIHVLTRKHKKFHPVARSSAAPVHRHGQQQDDANQGEPDSVDLSASTAPTAYVVGSATSIELPAQAVAAPIVELVTDLRSPVAILSFVPRPPPSLATR